MAFNNVWDLTYEGTPADGTAANQLGARIRELKLDIREHLDIEHDFGSGGTGRHKLPSGTKATRDAITDTVTGMLFLRTDVHQIDRFGAAAWDEADQNWHNYEIGDAAAKAVVGAITGLPHGYLFFDTDDEILYRWNLADTTWYPVNGKDFYTTKEATDDDQAMVVAVYTLITGMTQAVVIPDDGQQYEILVQAFVPFGDADTNNSKIEIEIRRDIGAGMVQQREMGFDVDVAPKAGNLSIFDHFTTPANAATITYEIRGKKSAGVGNWNPTSSSPGFGYMIIHVKPRMA